MEGEQLANIKKVLGFGGTFSGGLKEVLKKPKTSA